MRTRLSFLIICEAHMTPIQSPRIIFSLLSLPPSSTLREGNRNPSEQMWLSVPCHLLFPSSLQNFLRLDYAPHLLPMYLSKENIPTTSHKPALRSAQSPLLKCCWVLMCKECPNHSNRPHLSSPHPHSINFEFNKHVCFPNITIIPLQASSKLKFLER